jgi:ArsR family metal-binding transcriptional regulator
MLVHEFTKVNIFRPECNFAFETVNVIATFDGDVSPVLPYLNASLGGYAFDSGSSTLTIKNSGKLVTIRPHNVAINGLKDQEEVYRVLEWLKREINTTYEQRDTLQPSYKSRPLINMMLILKYLPKTNCQECGEATCLAFAAKVRDGEKGPDDCPPLTSDKKQAFQEFLTASGWTALDSDLW